MIAANVSLFSTPPNWRDELRAVLRPRVSSLTLTADAIFTTLEHSRYQRIPCKILHQNILTVLVAEYSPPETQRPEPEPCVVELSLSVSPNKLRAPPLQRREQKKPPIRTITGNPNSLGLWK